MALSVNRKTGVLGWYHFVFIVLYTMRSHLVILSQMISHLSRSNIPYQTFVHIAPFALLLLLFFLGVVVILPECSFLSPSLRSDSKYSSDWETKGTRESPLLIGPLMTGILPIVSLGQNSSLLSRNASHTLYGTHFIRSSKNISSMSICSLRSGAFISLFALLWTSVTCSRSTKFSSLVSMITSFEGSWFALVVSMITSFDSSCFSSVLSKITPFHGSGVFFKNTQGKLLFFAEFCHFFFFAVFLHSPWRLYRPIIIPQFLAVFDL